MPVYIAVGREVQHGLDRSRGGNSTKHQMRKLQQDGDGIRDRGVVMFCFLYDNEAFAKNTLGNVPLITSDLDRRGLICSI